MTQAASSHNISASISVYRANTVSGRLILPLLIKNHWIFFDFEKIVLRGKSVDIRVELQKIINIIVNEYQLDRIILFGSRAREDHSADSDIDILVVSDKEKHFPRYKRGLDVRVKLSAIKAPFDILFYTQEELDKYKNIQQSFSAAVLREGKVLYG